MMAEEAQGMKRGGQGGGSGNTMAGDRGDAKAEPSGPHGDNPSTGGRGETHVESQTPENEVGQMNPSSPGDTGTTPGSNAKVG